MNDMVPAVNDRIWMLFLLPIFIPMSWIRSYRYLAFTSIFGTFSLLLSLVTVVIYGFIYNTSNLMAPWNYPNFYININNVALFFGVTAFLYNTHTMVLPIEQSMEEPQKYYKTLDLGFLAVAIVNITFAVLVYMFFGDDIKDNATRNLPNNSFFIYLVKSCLGLELLLTFAIVLMPASELLEQKITKEKFLLKTTILRTMLVLLAFGIAEIFAGYFGLIMSFIGAVSPNVLGFILPSVFYLRLMWKEIHIAVKIMNILIIIFGVFALVICVKVSIDSL